MFWRLHIALPMMLGLILLTGRAIAAEETAKVADENAGQADLDKATEAKLSAQSLGDLAEVIRLCDKARQAGLSDASNEFATKLLAGTLVQRAEAVGGQIFDSPTPPARWQQLRRAALADLERAQGLDAGEPEVYLLIGRLNSLPGGDRKRAAEALDEAIKLSKREPATQAKALILRADLVDDVDLRQADLTKAVKLAPTNPEVLQARGLFFLTQEKYKEAVADLDASLALESDNPKVHEARGISLFLLKDYDGALASFNKVVELAPDSLTAFTQRARVRLVKGDIPGALADLDQALQIDPRSIGVLLLRASVLQETGKTDKALADVDLVLRLQPGLSKAVQMHAILTASKGQFSTAINDLEKLKRQSPDDAELLMQLALFYSADRQPQKAVELFGTLIKSNPKNWMAYRGRADAYLSLSKQDAAIEDYEAALKLEPTESGILNNLAWVLATAPDASLRDGKRAIELANKACEATKYKASHILSTLAAAYAETGDFDHAVEWSSKSVELGTPKLKAQLSMELESYKNRKPWREAHPADNVADDDDDDTADDAPDGKAESAEPTTDKDRDDSKSGSDSADDSADDDDDSDDSSPVIRSADNSQKATPDKEQAPKVAPADKQDADSGDDSDDDASDADSTTLK